MRTAGVVVMSKSGNHKPFFSRRLVPCAPDGTLSEFTLRRKVRLDRGGLHLGKILVDPAYLEEFFSYGPILKVRYLTVSGQSVEESLRNTRFRSRRAEAELADAVATAKASWGNRLGSAVLEQQPAVPSTIYPSFGETTGALNGRVRVQLSSAKVAFPPLCPVCCGTASHVSILQVSAGPSERGMWLVPVCERHEVADSIRLEKWRANATELAFSFSQSDYARHFSWANENNDSGGREMPSGRRFIVYSYVFSAVYFSASLRSRVFAIGEVDSRVVPGIRYSLLTFITGWWAVAGIFLSIDALAQNFRGGTDVTDLARRAFEGVPVSAYGVK